MKSIHMKRTFSLCLQSPTLTTTTTVMMMSMMTQFRLSHKRVLFPICVLFLLLLLCSFDIAQSGLTPSQAGAVIAAPKVAPTRAAVATPPPRAAVAGPPPRAAVATPPPKWAVATPPPRAAVAGPPPKWAIATPPPRAAVATPPPPRAAVAGPPPRAAVATPPPKPAVATPPKRAPPKKAVVTAPRVSPPKASQAKPQDPKCLLPMDPGPCRMSLERFYYNKEKKTCETFKFGGCQGNDNRFGFRQTCEEACVR